MHWESDSMNVNAAIHHSHKCFIYNIIIIIIIIIVIIIS